ncbi:hypothetical protein NL676_030040 [Syzygium grande]|nr:hypothetical protein NL676_030040 [Syzygium grande]
MSELMVGLTLIEGAAAKGAGSKFQVKPTRNLESLTPTSEGAGAGWAVGSPHAPLGSPPSPHSKPGPMVTPFTPPSPVAALPILGPVGICRFGNRPGAAVGDPPRLLE